ncbi:hypothetical protein EBT25_13415 [bacterium]|nr:hypothetical protein [bacterium]
MTKDQMNDFIDYVIQFYGPDGIYPMGANRTIARKATDDVIRICKIKGQKFCGDSIDRELVRDLMIDKYKLQIAK